MPHDPARVAEVRAWLARGVVDRAVPLTEYAWRFRYPGEDDAPTDDEAEDALATARAVLEAITTRLPPDVGGPSR